MESKNANCGSHLDLDVESARFNRPPEIQIGLEVHSHCVSKGLRFFICVSSTLTIILALAGGHVAPIKTEEKERRSMKIARNLELFPWPVLEPAFGVPTTGELTNPAFYALLALMKPDYRISGIRNARDDDDAIGANPFGNPLVSDF